MRWWFIAAALAAAPRVRADEAGLALREAPAAPSAPAALVSGPAPVWGKYVNSMLIKTRTAATYPENLWVFTYVGSFQPLENSKDAAQSRKQVTNVLWAEYGVRSWMLLGVAAPIVWREAVNPAVSPSTATAAGLGDVSAYGKVQVLTESKWLPGVSVDGFLKLPTGAKAKGLGNGEVDVTLALEASKRFGALSFHLNPEYVLTGGDRSALGAAAADRFNLNAGVMWHALPSLVPMVEYNGFWWGEAGEQSDVGGGVLWFPFSNLSIKLSVATPVYRQVTWSASWTPWLKVAAWF